LYPLRNAFKASLDSGVVPNSEAIAYLVKDEPEFDELSWTTTLRRSSTIRAWLEWVFENSRD